MNIPLRRRALLIGVERYRNSAVDEFAAGRTGPALLREVLADPAVGGFEVTVVTDPTAGGMRRALSAFCADREPDELTLVHLSCRGTRTADGGFVLAASDTDPARAAETGVTAGFVTSCLEDCWSDQKIVLLDSCGTGTGTPPVDPALTRGAPLTPRGVYVLAAPEGPGAPECRPTPGPTEFASAVALALRSGATGTGALTADDLYDAVHRTLRGATPPRVPVRSTIRVTGRIPLLVGSAAGAGTLAPSTAAGPATTAGTEPAVVAAALRLPAHPPVPAGTAPDPSRLLAYFHEVARTESTVLPLLPVDSAEQVFLRGRERAVRDDVDADGCIPVPAGAERLLRRARAAGGPELWAGWPTVVLHGAPGNRGWSVPRCAPLFVRRVEVVPQGDDAPRLRPIGPVVPHSGLAHLRLGAEDAVALIATHRPTWHRGESERPAQEAAQLLHDRLGLPSLEELHPERLTGPVDAASPLDGARNAAVLFGARPVHGRRGVLADLDRIMAMPAAAADTALAELLPGAPAPLPEPPVPLVTPRAANAAQRAVLDGAMTRRLTVATGPAGTGKSQLIVDVVATAVAAGQTVLVASSTDRAVDEIWRRCEEVAPGVLVRSGGPGSRAAEAAGLEGLMRPAAPQRSTELREIAFRHASQLLGAAETALREVATRESELLALGRARAGAQGRLGRPCEELTQLLGIGWGARARALAGARFLGGLRRRRFLRHAGLPPGPDRLVETCSALADLAHLDERWRAARAARPGAADAELHQDLATAQHRLELASTELLAGALYDRATAGWQRIAELLAARRHGVSDWAEFRQALPHVPGWALTCGAARRLPFGPALFDLVVIDEAGHCSIPEVVPLLFRARRALVIGDPMQLTHVSTIPAHADAVLRSGLGISREWLARHRLSPVRHSAFAAAERAAGGAALLQEHYRCHPAIAAVPDRLFYGGQLAVLTDARSSLRPGPPVVWRQVRGQAERGVNGTSWRNGAEAEEVAAVVAELLAGGGGRATVGVVTPYRAQAEELRWRLAGLGAQVLVGTPQAFQGSEHDVVVLSLVAAGNVEGRLFDGVDEQRELWNVALTRARGQLVVVGDGTVWSGRGGVGGELLRAAEAPPPTGSRLDADLLDRLESALAEVPGATLGASVHGHRADALLPHGDGRRRPVLVDPGAAPGGDPAAHLARMLRLRMLLGEAAVRLPGWVLHDADGEAVRRVAAGP